MRGKRACGKFCRACRRITPADAGKTKTDFNADTYYRDHPRGCGENCSAIQSLVRLPGSPPRMRGKLRDKTPTIIIVRITPADAGKTVGTLFAWVNAQDHPRGCGENCCAFMRAAGCLGSPPRMRGKLVFECAPPELLRITPADAGKTIRICP